VLEPPAMASAVIVTGERHALPLDVYSGSAGGRRRRDCFDACPALG
jgi:hypothetical protein